jgi:hypothetical protein
LDIFAMATLDRKNDAMAKIRSVEEILRRWDPIGVQPGTMAPVDEYDSYAPHVVSLVESGCTVEELAVHLEYPSTTTIGVGSNPEVSATVARRIVEMLRPSNKSLDVSLEM